jgi:hypothetical protein
MSNEGRHEVVSVRTRWRLRRRDDGQLIGWYDNIWDATEAADRLNSFDPPPHADTDMGAPPPDRFT